ncbi:hypothetical protein FSP39_014223 [Pinctada imbricata]|uniref:lysoplasmalogenase n=1 Tax=Pinctada imbricata TaxID=66713 RepID=A0AA89C1S9_PINIB|nr:hypothetical protein FSP39_014223 [Pinctada imbricata]
MNLKVFLLSFQLKSVGPKLVPFFKTVAIFFVLFGEDDKPGSIVYCIVKCLPVISLMLFVLLNGMNLAEYYRYSRRVLIGLVFSCVGDICLVWPEKYFELGILMFAIAQVSYARAFGWRPLKPYHGGAVFLVGSLIFLLLSPTLKGIILYLVAGYITLIGTMAWRAVARVELMDDLWTWTKLCGCGGALLFVISDVTIAVNKFAFRVPCEHQIIMLTYYAAQLGITLSVVDSPIDELLEISGNMQNGAVK